MTTTKITAKRLVSLLIALSLLLSVVLVACQQDCTQHKDDNADGKCDICGYQVCDTHIDLNDDSRCDVCGNVICAKHKDADGNGRCDNCACAVAPCTSHVDGNGDGKCDICSKDMPKAVSIQISAATRTIRANETLPLVVSVQNATDSSYTWSYNPQGIVQVDNNNVVRVIKESVRVDVYVTITATSAQDSSARASITVCVKPPKATGQVGELTSAMLDKVSNPNITVSGTVTDVYRNNTNNSVSQSNWEFSVLMNEGAWRGSWNKEGSREVISSYYRRSNDIVKNDDGMEGYAIEELYISKDNQVAAKRLINYRSKPTIWETQHMWNHMDQLNIKKFHLDEENGVYAYEINLDDEDELYLFTYLMYSFTPMLSEDTFSSFYLTVVDGEITQVQARTVGATKYGENQTVLTEEYSIVTFTFSDIGKTVLEEPDVYASGGLYIEEVLKPALQVMQNATSYTFSAKETQVQGPSYDESEYEVDIYDGANYAGSPIRNKAIVQPNGPTGTVGMKGWVTTDAVLLCQTGKYSAGLDSNLYHYTYTGYKQMDSKYYDHFVSGKINVGTEQNPIWENAYIGDRKYEGTIAKNVMPQFQFSADLFKYTSDLPLENGTIARVFTLQETAISRDIALQLGWYQANNAAPTTFSGFTIVATANGIISVKYPYDASGVYLGYIETTFSNVNNTVLPLDNDGVNVFSNYQTRRIPSSWSETTTKSYSPTNSTQNSRDVASDTAFYAAYGEKYMTVNAEGNVYNPSFPSYQAFFNTFGDSINGPFYDWTELGESGSGVYRKNCGINAQAAAEDRDENTHISLETFLRYMDKLEQELSVFGFHKDPANTDVTGGATGNSPLYMSFVNNDFIISVENIGTSFFYIEIYNLGEWTLHR